MPLPRTEIMPLPEARIDALPVGEALALLLDGQIAAAGAVRAALPQIAAGAGLIAQTLRSGGALAYVAAGSSGLMALADAVEIPGTFGVSPDQIRIFCAGGIPVDGNMPGDTEDDITEAPRIAAGLGLGDLVIALSASGTTPFPCAVAGLARARGIKVVALANNAGSPLLQLADVAILLATPPEVLAGSTRMGAGTAQKVALNLLSTWAGVLLGHIHDGLMVNLRADNDKLRRRAAMIVASISGATPKAAADALRAARDETKLAVLLAAGGDDATSRRLLHDHGGHLRPCLQALGLTHQL